jgi:hypothetical protein
VTAEKIPTNVRKKLAQRLKELRGDRRQEDVVGALRTRGGRWSVTKLSRIENNQARVQPDEVEDMFVVYKLDDPAELEKLKQWAKVARQKGLWQQRRRDLPENLMDFVDYEDKAVVQRVWEPVLVPALCQTPEYASTVIAGLDPSVDQEELTRRVDARLARQSVLTGEDPQELWVVLDERVITQRMGSTAVRIGQLRHLVEMATLPNVTLQVVPEDQSPHPGLSGWFSLLEFPNPDDADIGYTDGPGGSLYLEDDDDVRRCTLTFGHLLGIALKPEQSVKLINSLIEQLSGA